MADHASNGRFFSILGDFPHYQCKCGQDNGTDRKECLACGEPAPKFKNKFPKKGRLN